MIIDGYRFACLDELETLHEVISAGDVLKLIRAELGRVFPHTKFAVRSKPGGGARTRVVIDWHADTPDEPSVRTVVARYRGSVHSERSPSDPVAVEIEGRWVHYEISSVHCWRYDPPVD